MIEFTVIKELTGEVLFTGSTQSLEGLCRDGEVAIECKAPTTEMCWWDGVKFQEAPANSVATKTWDWETKAWVDQRTPAEARASAWERIKASRQAYFDAPLQTPYGVFDSDPKGRGNISSAVLHAQTLFGMGLPADTDFTLADDTVATLAPQEMIAVGLLLGRRVQQGYGIGRSRRARIDACLTVAQADAISWDSA